MPKDAGFKPQEQKVSVKIFLHHSGVLAAKFPYNQVNISEVTSLYGEMLASFVFDTSFARWW